MINPPTAPIAKIEAVAFVMSASGKFSKSPHTSPFNQPGSHKSATPITKPIVNRLMKAPVIAAVLLVASDYGFAFN